MAASGKRGRREMHRRQQQAREVALTQPQFGTTGGDEVSSQTGSAGSESGGAQYGTADSAGAAPQTGAGATQDASPRSDAKKMPRDRRRPAEDRNTPHGAHRRRN